MKSTITVRLDEDLEELLEQVSKKSNQSRSEIVRDALRRRLAVKRFYEIRNEMIPYAEKAGFYTDEDVFREVS